MRRASLRPIGAKPEHEQRAKTGIAVHPQDHLLSGRRHFNHQHPLNISVRCIVQRTGNDLVVCRLGGFAAGNADHDTAGLGFMQNLGRNDFHHHREPHVFGKIGRFRCIVGQLGRQDIESIASQNAGPLQLTNRRSSLLQAGRNNRPGLGRVIGKAILGQLLTVQPAGVTV
jgi:hypothetical protein